MLTHTKTTCIQTNPYQWPTYINPILYRSVVVSRNWSWITLAWDTWQLTHTSSTCRCALEKQPTSYWLYLILRLRMLHVVKDTEDDLEDVIPPVSQECISVSLQYFKHHSQASVHTANLPIHFTLCTYSLTVNTHVHRTYRKQYWCHRCAKYIWQTLWKGGPVLNWKTNVSGSFHCN